MKINMAHLHGQGIDFAVFDADARSRMHHDRANLLSQLMLTARRAGLKVDTAALAFRHGDGIMFYGAPHLVRHLQRVGIPRWTHRLDV